MVFYSHGGEIEFVPLKSTNYQLLKPLRSIVILIQDTTTSIRISCTT